MEVERIAHKRLFADLVVHHVYKRMVSADAAAALTVASSSHPVGLAASDASARHALAYSRRSDTKQTSLLRSPAALPCLLQNVRQKSTLGLWYGRGSAGRTHPSTSRQWMMHRISARGAGLSCASPSICESTLSSTPRMPCHNATSSSAQCRLIGWFALSYHAEF